MIKHNLSGDGFDDWVESSNRLFGYSDNTVEWAEVDGVTKDSGIQPEWFYNILAGTPDFSELNAIRLYRADVNKFDDIATTFSGISFVEMEHYDHLQELILALGGKVDNIPYSNTELVKSNEASKDNVSALQEAIQGEMDTITEYNKLRDICSKVPNSKTKEIVLNILDKLIADERKHIDIFTELLNKYNIDKPDSILNSLAKKLNINEKK